MLGELLESLKDSPEAVLLFARKMLLLKDWICSNVLDYIADLVAIFLYWSSFVKISVFFSVYF